MSTSTKIFRTILSMALVSLVLGILVTMITQNESAMLYGLGIGTIFLLVSFIFLIFTL